MNGYDPNSQQYQVAYQTAQRRVRAKMAFYSHLTSYILVNALLIAIYLFTGPVPGFYTYPWFVWPMIGWGVGLAFHFLGTFVFGQMDTPIARQRMIEEEMRKLGGAPRYYTPTTPQQQPTDYRSPNDTPRQ